MDKLATFSTKANFSGTYRIAGKFSEEKVWQIVHDLQN